MIDRDLLTRAMTKVAEATAGPPTGQAHTDLMNSVDWSKVKPNESTGPVAIRDGETQTRDQWLASQKPPAPVGWSLGAGARTAGATGLGAGLGAGLGTVAGAGIGGLAAGSGNRIEGTARGAIYGGGMGAGIGAGGQLGGALATSLGAKPGSGTQFLASLLGNVGGGVGAHKLMSLIMGKPSYGGGKKPKPAVKEASALPAINHPAPPGETPWIPGFKHPPGLAKPSLAVAPQPQPTAGSLQSIIGQPKPGLLDMLPQHRQPLQTGTVTQERRVPGREFRNQDRVRTIIPPPAYLLPSLAPGQAPDF